MPLALLEAGFVATKSSGVNPDHSTAAHYYKAKITKMATKTPFSRRFLANHRSFWRQMPSFRPLLAKMPN